jgi:hypothetical protein
MTISVTDFLKLPPAVMGAFIVLIWPALWAAASLLVAFAGDVLRHKRRAPYSARKAA